MKLLIYLGHPAQYHFFKYIIRNLRAKGHEVKYAIKSKDVLEQLLIEDNEEYVNILPEGRKSSQMGFLSGLLRRELRLFPIIRSFNPDLMMGTDPSIAHLGKLFGIPVLTVIEDDYNVVPYLPKLTYPFTNNIIAPSVCDCGKWSSKKISYNGYMKLAYLHPEYFKPEKTLNKNYVLIRLSKLDAYHDKGIHGFNKEILNKVIDIINDHFDIKIISEKPLDNEYRKYILRIKPNRIHNYLYNASIFISDSQSMSVESSILGTPSLRFSSFAGKINVLEELEKKYYLTYGINPQYPQLLLDKLKELINTKNLRGVFRRRSEIMLKEKINVTNFFTWLIDEYPISLEKYKWEMKIFDFKTDENSSYSWS